MNGIKGRLLLMLAVAALLVATVAAPATARGNDHKDHKNNIHKVKFDHKNNNFHKNKFDHDFDRHFFSVNKFDHDFDDDFFFVNKFDHDFDDHCIGVVRGFDCIGVDNRFDHGHSFFWPWWGCWRWSDVFDEWRWECD